MAGAGADIQIVHRWLSYERLPGGVRLSCQTVAGAPAYAAVTFPLPGVVRLRLRPGPLAERSSEMLAPRGHRPTLLEVKATPEGISLSSSLLTVHLAHEPWQLVVETAGGAPVFAEHTGDRLPEGGWAAAPVGWQRRPGGRLAFREVFHLAPDEALFGLGAHPGPLNRRGQVVHYLGTPAPQAACTIPFVWSTRGYGFFVHSYCPATFDLGARSPASGLIVVDDDELDYFVIAGPHPADILRRYAALTGAALVPPAWAFGVWIGQMGDAGQEAVEETCATLRGRHIPCDAVHVEGAWSPGAGAEGCSLTWNDEAFPAPGRFVAELRELGFRVGVSVSPAVPAASPLYAEGEERDFLLRHGLGGRRPRRSRKKAQALVDLSLPAAQVWWQGRLSRVLAAGVSALFVASGAPGDALLAGEAPGSALRGRYPLLCQRVLLEALRARCGGDGMVAAQGVRAGSQAVAVAWDEPSGTGAAHMVAQLQRALNLGLSGLPLWLGGTGDCRDPALLIRWCEFALLSTLARLHAANWETLLSLGWDAEETVRQYARLRNSLVPYLYSTAVAAAQSGLPVMRPLVLSYPEDRNTWGLDREYLLGDSLLVAPAWDEGEIEFYLPAGRWVDYWTDAPRQGPGWVRYPAPLDRLPLLVRAGAIIPQQPPSHYVEERDPGSLTFDLYPQADGRFTLYDRGGAAHNLRLAVQEDRIELLFSHPHALAEAVLHAVPRPSTVSVDGQPAAYDWQDGRARVVLGQGTRLVYCPS